MKKITSEDCLSCGLCCMPMNAQDRFCDVTTEDLKRLPKKFVRLNVIKTSTFDLLLSAIDGGGQLPPAAIRVVTKEAKKGPLKGLHFHACAALQGTPLEKVRCSIYKNRPIVCHTAVKPGDKACRQTRKIYKDYLDRRARESQP